MKNYPDHDFSLIDSSKRQENNFGDDGYLKKITSLLTQVLKKPVRCNPEKSTGALWGEVTLSEQTSLRFYVSAVGPFFSIHGVSDNALVVSPVSEYNAVFIKLESFLRSNPAYKFLPYEIGMATLPGETKTIYEKVFGPPAVHPHPPQGDVKYGFEDWSKIPIDKKKVLLDLISEHQKNAPDNVTVHKVWTEKKRVMLDFVEKKGNLMFGMDFFKMMDLTNGTRGIFISDNDQSPGKLDYEIIGDMIKFSDQLSLRILSLTKDTLTVRVVVNIVTGKTSLKGELAESLFVSQPTP